MQQLNIYYKKLYCLECEKHDNSKSMDNINISHIIKCPIRTKNFINQQNNIFYKIRNITRCWQCEHASSQSMAYYMYHTSHCKKFKINHFFKSIKNIFKK